jgi:O-antigen/teichoic acid export membrane protein
MTDTSDLKEKVLKGGVSLTISQFVVAALSFASVLVTARLLGPANYGIVTVSFGIFYFLTWSLKLGAQVYLVRQPNLSEEVVVQMQTFYVTLGVFACVILWFLAPVAGWWAKQSEVTHAFRWLLPAIWMNLVSSPSTSMLERKVRFVEIGFIEAFCQTVNYGLSIALVLAGWGYFSLIIATVVRFTIMAFISYALHPVPWSWRWQWKVIVPALRYGSTYSISDLLGSLKNLRVSLLVSRFVGVEAAGIIGIAIRLVDQLSMLRSIILRMSLSVMAKLIDDPEKTRRVISKGMAYQALLNGGVCAFFSVSSAWVIPLMFSKSWLSTAEIFPFIAIGALAIAIFDLHTSTLFAAGHNRDVVLFNFLYAGTLWLTSSLLTPRLGILGYGVSEVLALPIFFSLHYSVLKLCGSPNYWNTLWIFLATAVPLFGGMLLPPIWATGLFILSYSLLLAANKNIRNLLLELRTIKQPA